MFGPRRAKAVVVSSAAARSWHEINRRMAFRTRCVWTGEISACDADPPSPPKRRTRRCVAATKFTLAARRVVSPIASLPWIVRSWQRAHDRVSRKEVRKGCALSMLFNTRHCLFNLEPLIAMATFIYKIDYCPRSISIAMAGFDIRPRFLPIFGNIHLSGYCVR
jgi:hypothetical protein